MKIILPLTALGLLSTLFLISQSVDPTKSIPVVKLDLEQRAQDQGATNAAFAGVTRGGDEIMITAEAARPVTDTPNLIKATDVKTELRLMSGTIVMIVSNTADMNQSENSATLIGGVKIQTTTNYRIETQRLDAQFENLLLETPGTVAAQGPLGDITAGRMVLSSDELTNSAHLLFTGGVKLVYTGHIPEE